MIDINDRYLRGVEDLRKLIDPADTDGHLRVLTLQGRLATAISERRQFGPTESANSEIARVITELNRICLGQLDQSFLSLCGIPESAPVQPQVLHNLPARPFFVGRQRELRQLQEYLSPEWRVALISIDGIGGLGKTTLALELSHRLLEARSFDVIVWTTAKGRRLTARGIIDERPDFTTFEEFLAVVAAAMLRDSSQGKSEAIKQALANSRGLVIVDNFETIQDARIFDFLRRIPGNSKGLITNRYRRDAELRGGEIILPLKGMEQADAFELLRKSGRMTPTPLRNADDALLARIFERSHGNPAAMQWVILQLERGQPAERVIERLGQPKANDLYRFIFEDSFNSLSVHACRVLWALAAIDKPAVEDQVCFVSELSPGELERASDELIGTSLISVDSGRYYILDITQEYAVAQIGQDLDRLARRADEWLTQLRYDRLSDAERDLIQRLGFAEGPIPIPTLEAWLKDIDSKALIPLLSSLEDAGLVLFDRALQRVSLESSTRDYWQAHLRDSGAIARGGGVAAGKYNIAVGGDVHGIVIGDGAQVVVNVDSSRISLVDQNIVVGEGAQVVVTYTSSFERYLNHVIQSTSTMPMIGMKTEPFAEYRAQLQHLFVAPYTIKSGPRSSESIGLDTGVAEEQERLQMLSALAPARRAVVLGDPGSGKTTLLRFLTWAAASQGLGRDIDILPEWPRGFPILISARDYSGRMSAQRDEPLAEFLFQQLASAGFADLVEYVKSALVAGECLLLIDGIDELSDIRQRHRMATQIEDLALQYPGNQVIVTSRTHSYETAALSSGQWKVFVIAPFGDEQINTYVKEWYKWLIGHNQHEAAGALAAAEELIYTIHRDQRLRAIASNPLLLSVITTLHFTQGQLPQGRIALYSEASDLLLWRWEQAKLVDQSWLESSQHQGLQKSDLQAALAALAFRMHSEQATVIDSRLLSETLLPLLGSSWENVTGFLEYVKQRTGLLHERAPNLYSFVHLSMQEFYAARHLMSQPGYPMVGVEILRRDFTWWQEVYLQSVLYSFASGSAGLGIHAIEALLPKSDWSPVTAPVVTIRLVILAGQALAELGASAERSAAGKDLTAQARQLLAEVIATGAATASERAQAGDILSQIGDPRLTAVLAGNTLVPDIAFCDVPAGPFLMGTTRGRDPDASDDEAPQHTVLISYAYSIGKYPITNAEYRYFVEDDGYFRMEYWTEEGWKWKEQNSVANPEFWGDPVWARLNTPVVGVSWHEAIAFCRWLSSRTGESYRLPTEAEWEKAARGSDARSRPWGNERDSERANTMESGFGGTTAVGVYPAGASPHGCLDMSGNVWEWTTDLFSNYPYESQEGRESIHDNGLRVIRGGAWSFPQSVARTTSRAGMLPAHRSPSLGFRVRLEAKSSIVMGNVGKGE